MKHRVKFAPLLLLTSALWANETSYWQCTTSDKDHKQWVMKSIYERAARANTFNACKKNSGNPASCKTDCEGFNHGVSIRPAWQCTALDQNAKSWISETHANQDDAAIDAETRCKQFSTVPESCYLNLIACKNVNHWP